MLAEHVRDSRSRVSSQKQLDKRDPAHHILGRSHVEAGCWRWLIQFHHPRVLHRPLNWQDELFKGTKEDQGAFNIIRAKFVSSVYRQSSILWTQNTCEKEVGTGIPTVVQGNIVAIILNAVRKLRDHTNGILHTAIYLSDLVAKVSASESSSACSLSAPARPEPAGPAQTSRLLLLQMARDT